MLKAMELALCGRCLWLRRSDIDRLAARSLGEDGMTASMHGQRLMTDLKFRTLPLPQLITGTSGLWRGVTLPVLGNWMPTLTDRLLDLSRLPVGWDGDRGLPVDVGVVRMSHGLLQFLCDAGMPEPVVVPTPSGGLQIEWHDATTEIDLATLPRTQPATLPSGCRTSQATRASTKVTSRLVPTYSVEH